MALARFKYVHPIASHVYHLDKILTWIHIFREVYHYTAFRSVFSSAKNVQNVGVSLCDLVGFLKRGKYGVLHNNLELDI